MSVYTTIDELTKRLHPQVLAGLADDINPVPDIDDTLTRDIINQAIADGGAVIDGYVLGRIDMGNEGVTAALERINATLTLYYLYRRRYVDDDLNPLSASRQAVIAYLEEVATAGISITSSEDTQ